MQAWTDERLEGTIATLLRAGVILSAMIVLGGGICYLIRHGHESVSYRTFHSEPMIYRTISGVVRASFHGDWAALIQLGLLLLIATPVARVVLSLVAFAMEPDRIYIWITLAVLLILVYALFGKY